MMEKNSTRPDDSGYMGQVTYEQLQLLVSAQSPTAPSSDKGLQPSQFISG